jgi:hypothetical protein
VDLCSTMVQSSMLLPDHGSYIDYVADIEGLNICPRPCEQGCHSSPSETEGDGICLDPVHSHPCQTPDKESPQSLA